MVTARPPPRFAEAGQYLRYIELMQVLQLELAGEYLLMAATLAEVKSRMLLPRPQHDDLAEESDPRAELVRRLQEYERFKRAAEGIDRMPRVERDTWVASADLVERKVARIAPLVTLQEMLMAFQELLARNDRFARHHVQREIDRTVEGGARILDHDPVPDQHGLHIGTGSLGRPRRGLKASLRQ